VTVRELIEKLQSFDPGMPVMRTDPYLGACDADEPVQLTSEATSELFRRSRIEKHRRAQRVVMLS
jgi:hypothetical protein